jgi:xylose isomerase
MRLELKHLAELLRQAADYSDQIGFSGQLYIEPKAKEPTTHQYDFDVATVQAFLLSHHLGGRFKINYEPNHGQLAGHTTEHEMAVINALDLFGSIDANQGTETLGWDTDELPHDLPTAVAVMLGVLRAGGFTTGGLNFDAKLRRTSTDLNDLIKGFIMAMDTYALALKIAARIINDGILKRMVEARYRRWQNEAGQTIESGQMTLQLCDWHASQCKIQPQAESGHAEYFNDLIAAYLRQDPVIIDQTESLYPEANA